MEWKNIYEQYPVNQELIWLNNCGTTPASLWSVQRVTQFLESYSHKGIFSEKEKIGNVRSRILQILSNLLGCFPEELAITHNTAEGINFFSRGIRLNSGDQILLLENEYPSNVYPWEHWKEKGVSIDFIPVGSNPDQFLENFQSKITNSTKMVSLSAVHWCTGMPISLEKVGKICSQKNILFVLDGAQGVGHTDMDLHSFGIDFMAFPAWKWLLGPLGLGVMFVRKDKLDKLEVLFKGTGTVKGGENYLPYKKELKDGSERFEYSTPNFNDWVYFVAILEKLEEIGFSNIQSRIFELAEHLEKGLHSLGFSLTKDTHKQNTGIIVAYHPSISSTKIVSYLKSKSVIVADRLGGVRFSPHIYISKEQLDRVLEYLQNIPKDL
jgi:selenocysteine lyase/cysteine desulfurase